MTGYIKNGRRRGRALLTASVAAMIALLPISVSGLPIGKPHQCSILYLRGNNTLNGTSVVAFFVTKSGTIKNQRVVSSSGNAQIDSASVECVKPWHYLPATKDGEPIEVPWVVDIAWNPSVLPDMTRIVRDCARIIGTRKEYANFQGETDFNLVYENQRLASVKISRSSGNPKVDEDEKNCISKVSELHREIVVVVADEDTAKHFDASAQLSYLAQITLNKSDYSAALRTMEPPSSLNSAKPQ